MTTKKLCSNIASISFQECDMDHEGMCFVSKMDKDRRRTSITSFIDPKYYKHKYNQKKIKCELKKMI